MSDTPRTDAILSELVERGRTLHELSCPETLVCTSRQLERELNAANERIKRMAAIGSRFVNANDLTEYIATEHAWIEEVKNIPA